MLDVEIISCNSQSYSIKGLLDESKGTLYVRDNENPDASFDIFHKQMTIQALQIAEVSKFTRTRPTFTIQCKTDTVFYSFDSRLSSWKSKPKPIFDVIDDYRGSLLVFDNFSNFIKSTEPNQNTNDVTSVFFKTVNLEKKYLNYFENERLSTQIGNLQVDANFCERARDFQVTFGISSKNENTSLSDYFILVDKLRHYLTLIFGSNVLKNYFKAFTSNPSQEFHTTIYKVHLYDSHVNRLRKPVIKIDEGFLVGFSAFVEHFESNDKLISMYISTQFTDMYQEVRLSLLVNSIEGFFRTNFEWAKKRRSNDEKMYKYNTEDLIFYTFYLLPSLDDCPSTKAGRELPDIDHVYGPNPGDSKPPFMLDRKLSSSINYHRNFYSHLNDFNEEKTIKPDFIPMVIDLLDLFFRVQFIHLVLHNYDEDTLISSMKDVYVNHINRIR
ncbi:hypothetical protein [Erysipelothrix anatis]|uniref:hypothetical protein n=1 Tax=Erysipelothrix anatis TaxID=2683713 RepID=UPI00135B85B7|nr:hypothetical protein [Erysipelothrix anatis]